MHAVGQSAASVIQSLGFVLPHHETMINLTKRLLSKSPVPRGLVLIRFPWSLVSIPLILLGWYHFSDQPRQKDRKKGVETADMLGGLPGTLVWEKRQDA